MNDYGFFYGSWSELLGHRDRVAAVSRADHVRTVPDGRGVVGGAGRVLDRAPFEAGSVPARDGKTVTVRLPGRRSGLAEIGFMHLPPEYFQPGWEHTQFPAVEVLTGYPGQATAQDPGRPGGTAPGPAGRHRRPAGQHRRTHGAGDAAVLAGVPP